MKNEYEIRGDATVIYLDRKDGTRLECLIDTEDLDKVLSLGVKWFVAYSGNGLPYVITRTTIETGRKQVYQIHRFLTDCPEDKLVDHENRNTLDNRKDNLRITDKSGNAQNISNKRNNTSGIRGVSYDSTRKKWRATIMIDGKHMNLGRFSTVEEAENVVKEARKKHMPFSAEARGE